MEIRKSKMSNITQKWVELLSPYLAIYSAKLTASELARKSKIPQQTASRLLNKLVKVNLINYAKEGKNKFFYFDLELQTTRIVLNLIESHKALNFQLKEKKIAIAINEILKHSESLIVFGSYASGNFTKESDIDIVILGKHNREEIKRIKEKQIVQISEHYTNYNEFTNLLKSRNPLALEIMQNHILFGDVSKIVDIFWRIEYERR